MKNKKFYLILFSLVFLITLHFVILNEKITQYDYFDVPQEAVAMENWEGEKTGSYYLNKNGKTKFFLKINTASSGELKSIILGYFKNRDEVTVLMKSFPDKGGFAVMGEKWYVFSVEGDYNDLDIVSF